MQQIQFLQTTPQQLQSEINAGVKIILEDFLKNFKPKLPNEYLSRQDVALMFGVDISTVHNWCIDIPTKVPHHSALKVAIYSGAKYASQTVLYHH